MCKNGWSAIKPNQIIFYKDGFGIKYITKVDMPLVKKNQA